MQPQWIIEKKRDGGELTQEEIHDFITHYATGKLPDYQMSALAMAVFLRGMSAAETASLTSAMHQSGITLDFADIPTPKIDKHSTGGVGDKISLILAPLAAAAGLTVPMIAGRGLGPTGGTIDKLESIPGYRTALNPKQFKKILQTCGCSIIAQSDKIAPADKKLYGLRDVTGTVQSEPLIVASILSKKLAAGLDGLVLDVKWGQGAFMSDYNAALSLANSLVTTAAHLGLPCRALLTDMNQPLGHAAGNAPEVLESLEVLKGNGPPDIRQLTLELCAHMLCLGNKFDKLDSAGECAAKLLASGAAYEKFLTMVELHGGNPRIFDSSAGGPALAPLQQPLSAQKTGYIANVNAGTIGRSCIALGAGRTLLTDQVDPGAGITEIKKVGEAVEKGTVLALLHSSDKDKLNAGYNLANQAFEISETPPAPLSLIRETIT